jgi:hypothetical protein
MLRQWVGVWFTGLTCQALIWYKARDSGKHRLESGLTLSCCVGPWMKSVTSSRLGWDKMKHWREACSTGLTSFRQQSLTVLFDCLIFVVIVWDKVSLCSPGLPWTLSSSLVSPRIIDMCYPAWIPIPRFSFFFFLFLFFFFWSDMGFELRAYLLGKQSTTWAIRQHFLPWLFLRQGLTLCLGWPGPWSYLCFPA